MEESKSNPESVIEERQIFAEYPVPKAVATMVIPTVISQVITVVYNLADTWYVGLAENAAAVAAISLCLPLYNIMTAIANLFGIGGSSVIARALGVGEQKRAKYTFAISVQGALFTTAFYCILLAWIAKPFLIAIGADETNITYALQYVRIIIVIGGIPTVLSAVLAHLIRSMGNSSKSSFGIALGAILNIILDPLFMFIILPSGNEVLGAAIATAISNMISLIYFLHYITKNKDNGIFCLCLWKMTGRKRLSWSIIKCGLPSFVLLAMGQVSNFVLNGMIAGMGSSTAVAGIGIVRKIDSVAYAVNQGITQGMLPIVAYCFSSGRLQRMKKVIRFSSCCTVIFSLLCSVLSYLFAPQLIGIFIRDTDTIYYGTFFLRIICISVAIYPLLFVIIAIFQAVGQSVWPFVLSLLNKGTLDILLFFLIRSVFGDRYILWATPIMAAVALFAGMISILRFIKRLKA